jgi:hypothetical protein
MAKKRLFPVVLLLILVLMGCRLVSPRETPTPQAVSTATPLPTAPSEATIEPTLALPTPTMKPRPTQTSTPFLPVSGKITVQNFKLRSGPGFLFDTVGLYDEGETVQIYGRCLGGGWLFVSTSDYRSGWMKSEYIDLSGEIDQIPYYGYSDADMLFGHVKNGNGDPIYGIGIVIFPAIDSQDSTKQDVATTDDSGAYYLFLPKDLSGNYTIGVNAYSDKSNAVNSDGAFMYGFPSAQSIELPHQADISIEFVLPPPQVGQ